MSAYIIQSLPLSNKGIYRGQIVYWNEGEKGFTTDVNKAGLISRSKIEANPNRYNNGETTKAILFESEVVPEQEFVQMQLHLQGAEGMLSEQKKRYAALKVEMSSLEVAMMRTESDISTKARDVQIQTFLRNTDNK